MRQPIKGLNSFYSEDFNGKLYIANEDGDMKPAETFHKLKKGDTVYVRETWQATEVNDGGAVFIYKADLSHRRVKISRADRMKLEQNMDSGWKPSIHMPKIAARLFLRVKDVRAEKLQDITEEDIKAEGAENKEEFQRLWDGTLTPAELGKYSWAENPWVWVIEFERMEQQ